MNPLLDEILVGVLIFGALAYFVVPALRGKKKGCGCGCECPAAKPFGRTK